MVSYVSIFLLAVSCASVVGQNSTTNKLTEISPLSSRAHLFTTGIKHFSLELLYHTAILKEDNLIMSPITVWTLMTAMSEGARGHTRKEMKSALRLPKDMTFVRSAFQNITKYLAVNTNTVTLERVSIVATDPQHKLNDTYSNLLRSIYQSEVFTLDFKFPAAARVINQHISRATHGRISEAVLDKDIQNTRILLADAIYFKGQWASPFNKSETTKEMFYDDSGKPLGEVNMMFQRSVLAFANVKPLKAYVVELPYGKENRFSMLAILPHAGVALTEMFTKFTDVPFEEIFTNLALSTERYEGEEVDCMIPRFKISTDVVLNQPLNNLGIYELFDPNLAELPALSNSKLYVSQVIHKAEMEVTEEGTVASAVTVADLANRNSPPTFKANRPFVYIIIEKTTNVIVFGGIYSKPSLF